MEAKRYDFKDGCAGSCDCDIGQSENGTYVLASDYEAIYALAKEQAKIIQEANDHPRLSMEGSRWWEWVFHSIKNWKEFNK